MSDHGHITVPRPTLPEKSDPNSIHEFSATEKYKENLYDGPDPFVSDSSSPPCSSSVKLLASKKPRRICSIPSCTSQSVSFGKCRRHGGGKRCRVARCHKSTQGGTHYCWAHGGGKRCKYVGCTNGAVLHGWCRSHASHVRFDFTYTEVDSPDGPAVDEIVEECEDMEKYSKDSINFLLYRPPEASGHGSGFSG